MYALEASGTIEFLPFGRRRDQTDANILKEEKTCMQAAKLAVVTGQFMPKYNSSQGQFIPGTDSSPDQATLGSSDPRTTHIGDYSSRDSSLQGTIHPSGQLSPGTDRTTDLGDSSFRMQFIPADTTAQRQLIPGTTHHRDSSSPGQLIPREDN